MPYPEYFFAWTGMELLPLPTAYWGYAPDGYDYSEYLIFPYNGAPYNTIIKVISEATEFDAGYAALERKFATVVYEWNGREAQPVTQDLSIIENKRY